MKNNSYPNPELQVQEDNKPGWNNPLNRRYGFHNLYRQTRYGMGLRAPLVLKLDPKPDSAIEVIPGVRELLENPAFSALVVARETDILFEQYAEDFTANQPHSIQSITKLFVHLMLGEACKTGILNPKMKVGDYLPDIGSGYADAVIQDVMDMNVENSYTEDYDDAYATSYIHEGAIGWRLTTDGGEPPDQKSFLRSITSENLVNTSGYANYKSANTDVLAWLVEEASGKPVLAWMREIVEASGIRHMFHCSTDKLGSPIVNGGGCMTALDLARFGLLVRRGGKGVNGKSISSMAFIRETTSRKYLTFEPPRHNYGYSNQAFTNGRWIGHSGYGGQFLMVDPEAGVVCVFFSVLENKSAYDATYSASIVQCLENICQSV